MKKKQSNRKSSGKKRTSGLVMVLSVVLYFISEGFIRLMKLVQQGGGKTGEPKKQSRAAAKRRERRPNPVTAARQAEEHASDAAVVAPAVQKPQKQGQTAAVPVAKKPEKQTPAAAVPAAQKAEKQAPAATVPAAQKAEKQAPVASAPAAQKPEKQAPVAAPVVQKPEKKASPAVNAPEEQTPTEATPEAAPEAAKKPEKQGLFATAFAAKKAEKGAKADTSAKAFPTGLKPVTTAAPKAPEKPVVPADSRVPQTTGKLDRTIAAVTADKQPKEQAEKNPRKTIIIILFCLLVIAICVLAGIGIKRLTASIRAKNIYDDLSSSVQQAKDPAYNPTTAPLVTEPVGQATTPVDAEATEPVVETIPQETEPQMLPQYAPLYEKNSDLFGWVKIEDTKIDYPVMYAPDDLERYLYHDFERNSYSGGTPYMDVRCTSDSENYLIYGHNMKNGTMFKHLLNYQSEKFWKEHPTVYFDTLYEEGEYEVVAAFYDRVYYSYEDVFKFYNVIELEDEESYNEAIKNLREKSIYDTGVVPAYGTQLVTLITCAYHVDNGKFAVVLAEKAAG